MTPPRVDGCQLIAVIRASPWSSVDSMIRAITLDRLDGELTDAGLAGEHDRVGTVEHRVGDVGRLSPGRARRRDHRLEHLGGDDDGLGVAASGLDDLLLQHRDVLERHLDAQVTARHHDAVERGDDLVDVLDRLRLLDLGDDGQPLAPPRP